MAHVPAALFEAAVEDLRGRHPLAVFVIPAMAQAGVSVVAKPEDGAPFGSADEGEVLEQFFKVPGAPPGTPYHAVWADPPQWVDRRYPGRTAQRMRTDRVKSGQGFLQDSSETPHRWGFTADLGAKIEHLEGLPVTIADLAVWYGREREADDLDQLIEWFLKEFPIDQGDLIGTVYSDEVPDHYEKIPFTSEPLTQSDYAAVLENAPAPIAYDADLQTLAENVEKRVTAGGFVTSPGLIERILSAWVRGNIAVLVGHGGTGKTFLSHLLEDALREEFGQLTSVSITVTPDTDESDVVGYERLDGEPALRDLAVKVLQSDGPLDPHLVVLEEFNLALLEQYFGVILVALENLGRAIDLPGGETAALPVDTFILASCNSYLDEPETRARLSGPSKRRCAVITMPNVLLERYESAGSAAVITELGVELIHQERSRIEERMGRGLASTLDALRHAALEQVNEPSDFSDDARALLEGVGACLLDSVEGREFFTMAVLKDVALDLAYAPREREAEIEAVLGSVADKLVHQLRGPKQRADDLAGAIDDVPGAERVLRLLDRMKQGPGDELLALI